MQSSASTQIWRTLGGFMGLEWEYSPTEYARYEFVAWENDDSIQLRVATYVDHELKQGLPARLFKRDPGWHVEGPPELSLWHTTRTIRCIWSKTPTMRATTTLGSAKRRNLLLGQGRS
jgi:hypothetical protein